MWVLGLCGGGDVKLFAALGGWVGVQRLVLLWLLSYLVLILWTLGKVMVRGLRPSKVQASVKKLQKSEEIARKAAQQGKSRSQLRVTYSLPFAVATLLTCLWSFKYELGLLPPPPPPPATTGTGTNDVPATSEPTK
jgi:Flp pilus assembly protein protease CpaA